MIGIRKCGVRLARWPLSSRFLANAIHVDCYWQNLSSPRLNGSVSRCVSLYGVIVDAREFIPHVISALAVYNVDTVTALASAQ